VQAAKSSIHFGVVSNPTTAPRASRAITDREHAAAAALASVRAEGLDPRDAEPILERWARGELTTDQMIESAKRVAAGEPQLGAPSHAV